jgi:predicted nucleic-acid-binding Zn-ribbon protein
MKSGKCPKCGSENIYVSGLSRTTGSLILLKMGFFENKVASLIHYVCDDCQYSESYVADDESMKNIREHWTPMNPHKAKRKNDEA